MKSSRCFSKELCFNTDDLKQIEEIQKHFGWSDAILDTKIGTWMSKNLTPTDEERLPTIKELSEYERENKEAIKKEATKQSDYTPEMQQIKDQAIADGTFMKAPNGKPTNLDERQWIHVRTKAFKDWFGDWEAIAPQREFKNSLFRGQSGKPKIDENGNLVLHPTYDNLSKNTGISFANVKGAAIAYGSRYSKHPYIIELDADFLDKTHPLKESTEKGGRFIGDEYGDNAWEERISDTEDIIIPKGYYKIEEPSTDIFVSMSNTDIARKISELEELFNNQDEWADEAFAPRTSISEIKLYKDELERRRKYGVTEKIENAGIQHYSSFMHHTVEHNGKYYIVEDGDTLEKSAIEISKKDYEEFNKIGGIDIETFETHYYTNNSISNVSKVVDENGEPLVVYHGSDYENDSTKLGDWSNNVLPYATYFAPYKYAHGNFKYYYSAFLNIKNPMASPLMFTEEAIQTEEIFKKYLLDKGYDGAISVSETIEEASIDATKAKEIVVINPNQIKSATDNIGTYSTEDNDIRHNKDAKGLFDLLSYLAKTLKYTQNYTSVTDSQVHEVISKLYGRFHITKSDPVRAKQELENYRISRRFPEGLFNYETKNGTTIVTINDEVLKDAIERNTKNANFGDLFNSQEEAQAVKEVLDFLSAKTGLKYETISFEKAKKLNNKIDDSTNAFVKDGTCYFIEGKKLNVDIASEEMLHPFIAALRIQNKELFKNLLNEAKEAFPRLRFEIAESYKGRPLSERQEELVTQALSRAFRTELKNHPQRRQISELLNKFVLWVRELLSIGEKDYILTDEINANTTLTDLAKILNTELELVYNSSYKNITRENKELGPETKINIYAGTNENADLSNLAERPFTSESPLTGNDVTYKTVEGAFQAAKLGYTNLSAEEIADIETNLMKATGSQARSIGRRIKGLNSREWDKNSSRIMKALLKASFEQNPQALQRLLDTGNATLTHTQDKGKWGTEFPKLLMEVRDELRKEHPELTQQTEASQQEQQSESSQPINTHQEDTLVDADTTQKMHQVWDAQKLQYRITRFSKMFSDIVNQLEKDLSKKEQQSSSTATRKYILTTRYGSGYVLNKLRQNIQDTYANLDWVTNYVHDIYDEEDWNTQEVQDKINYIYQQGQYMLEFFEPLAIEASFIIKKTEGVSILTEDGEMIDMSEEELLTDEEVMTKHEEGWFYELHEQSIEETLSAETANILSNLYEVDNEGLYTEFDDLEEPLPIDFRTVLATTAKIVGDCTTDKQLIYKLKSNQAKYPWMKQIVDMLMGVDSATSSLYKDLSEEDIRLKAQSLQANFWLDMHKPHMNIAEQTITDTGAVSSKIVNNTEGSDALMKQFENNCYNNKAIWSEGKRFPFVYNSDGTFNMPVYDKIHAKINEPGLYQRILKATVTEDDIATIEEALKAFGADISKEQIRQVFIDKDINKINNLHKVLFGFYATDKAANVPLKDVSTGEERPNIYDAFRSNYKLLADVFQDSAQGREESRATVTVDNEQKSLFSRILPNPISTIINKLSNKDGLGEENYKRRLFRDYGKNWLFSKLKDNNGNPIFRTGIIKDLIDDIKFRRNLRIKTLIASNGVSYEQQIDAQAEETRLNEFEANQENGYTDYAVPTFSDTAANYFIRLRYFDIKDPKKRAELITRISECVRQEVDRINLVKARAQKNKEAIEAGLEPPIKPIAGFDVEYDENGKYVESSKDGTNFFYLPTLNENKNEFLEKFASLATNPEEQQKFLEEEVSKALDKEFEIYLANYNEWQVNQLPHSRHHEPANNNAAFIKYIEDIIANNPYLNETQVRVFQSFIKELKENTMTQKRFDEIRNSIYLNLRSNDPAYNNNIVAALSQFKLDTKNLEKLEDYFYNSFYASTQVVQITMRDPAFLGSTDKFQKRYKMFYSPVATCYTCEYDLKAYRETGELKLLDANRPDALTKQTEYSLILTDDIMDKALSFDQIKSAIDKRVVDGYLTPEQSETILDNFQKITKPDGTKTDGINRSDAQCYRTLPSWQKCLNMIGKGYNKKMQDSINRLTDPDRYGEWTYEDYHNVWEIFKPFVASYSTVDSGVTTEMGEAFSGIETPVMHKNAEFLLLAMYGQLSGVMKDNWRLKAINEFMVKHGIDKIQFESAVKVGNQGAINLNVCKTPEEITATLEGCTGLHNDAQAHEGDMQVVHSIPFSDWGISTSMPEHLLEHEESSMGTQLMKIIMEGMIHYPNKTLKVGNEEMTYKQWLEFYQAIEVQNIKDDFAKVGKIFNSNEELAKYLKHQILTQSKYSHDLLQHLKLDENGNFKNPIIDPLLRSQFDALCASLVRNRITKRMFRMGALPQVASHGFENRLRFTDVNGTLMRTKEEFEKEGSNVEGITTWEEYEKYANENSSNISHMEVYMPPFDFTAMNMTEDMFIYKKDVYSKDGKLLHKSGEFNQELFDKVVADKIRFGVGNRVPTETKHSMIPIKVVGFLPSQNSSCVVVPGEWIAISDSDNDGDKLYVYLYSSKAIWNTDKMKRDYAEHYGWKYLTKAQREDARKNKSNFRTTNYIKSEELDVMWETVPQLLEKDDPLRQLVTKEAIDEDDIAVTGTSTINTKVTTFKTQEDKEFRRVQEFYKQAYSMPTRYITYIEPIPFKKTEVERIAGETDSEYNHRVRMASISKNGHAARNNMMLDLMIGALRTDENTAQILIPGGFPIIKEVSDELDALSEGKKESKSICNPVTRTLQQIRNMAGKSLIGIYANHRSLRPLLEMANIHVNPDFAPIINRNESLPRENGMITYSMSTEKNAKGEFISDNISNYSGASVDNAKDPRLGKLGQNTVTAPITMTLIHMGYTIREVSFFMRQPAVMECVRQYVLNNRKVQLKTIVEVELEILRPSIAKSGIATDMLTTLPIELLSEQIRRSEKGILPTDDDNAVQAVVLENFLRILPLSEFMQRIVKVTKADTQVGALSARSAENKEKIQLINSMMDEAESDDCPVRGAEALVPYVGNEKDVDNAPIPHVAAFRYYGIESIEKFMKEISMTFNTLVEFVHSYAQDAYNGYSLDADTVDKLTDATVSYLFSGIEGIKTNKREALNDAVNVLSEIKEKGILDENKLIHDLVVNKTGNKFSRFMPFIKLPKNDRKNARGLDEYQTAWESLILNGNKTIKLKDKTITYSDLSNILFNYCFLVKGLGNNVNTFINCFPTSQIDTIAGYVDMLKKLRYHEAHPETAERILEQYIANNPEDYRFVHKVDSNEFSFSSKVLEKSKVVPSTITVNNNESNAALFNPVTEGAYNYILFTDKTGQRFLYKGMTTQTGTAVYSRIQVLGNAKNGMMEEYEQNKNVIYGDLNCAKSIIKSNNGLLMTTELKTEIDDVQQKAVEEGRTLSKKNYADAIQTLIGPDVKMNTISSYEQKTEDLTGIEFCVTI